MRYSLKKMNENDFYMNLYDDFIKTENVEDDKILWKTYKIIDLMKISNKNDSNGFMENGLRMIMLLFNQLDITLCDLCSLDLFDAFLNEKEELMLILQKEFI